MATQHLMAGTSGREESGVSQRTDEAAQRNDGSARSVVALTRELAKECEALARAEAALIKTEVSEKIADAEKGIAALVTGGATLGAGILVLLFAVVFALDRVLELWQAALLVGGGVTLIGAIMVTSGKHKLSAENLKPTRTLEQLSGNKGYAKEQAR
jgi:hypothetical protein